MQVSENGNSTALDCRLKEKEVGHRSPEDIDTVYIRINPLVHDCMTYFTIYRQSRCPIFGTLCIQYPVCLLNYSQKAK